MAYPQYDDTLQLIATQRIQQYIHEAEIDHLQSKMHPRGTGWWSRQARSSLGTLLTSLGGRLITPARSSTPSIREQSAS